MQKYNEQDSTQFASTQEKLIYNQLDPKGKRDDFFQTKPVNDIAQKSTN